MIGSGPPVLATSAARALACLWACLALVGCGALTPAAKPDTAGLLKDGSAITIIVPYDAGGGYDTTTRALAPCIETALATRAKLQARVVVQNVPGAGGKIGTQQVYASNPAQMTLLLNAVDIIASQQALENAQWDV